MTMKVIGLTGGIGAGKSTVSQILRQDYHLPVIDADAIAREIVLPGKPALQEIVQAFGSEILTEDGHMNRKKMGDLICRDAAAKRKLDEITHQAIQNEVEKAIEGYRIDNSSIVIYDCPLLFEVRQDFLCDRTVLVTVKPEIRLARLMARDGIDRETALAKMAIQMPEEEKALLADDVIDNSGDLAQLRAEIAAVYQKWNALQNLNSVIK